MRYFSLDLETAVKNSACFILFFIFPQFFDQIFSKVRKVQGPSAKSPFDHTPDQKNESVPKHHIFMIHVEKKVSRAVFRCFPVLT